MMARVRLLLFRLGIASPNRADADRIRDERHREINNEALMEH